MKPAQIAVGTSYEDKSATTIRSVTMIYSRKDGSGSTVEYIEHQGSRPLYRPLQRTKTVDRAEFAAWAARPAGKKEDIGSRAVRLARAQMSR